MNLEVGEVGKGNCNREGSEEHATEKREVGKRVKTEACQAGRKTI